MVSFDRGAFVEELLDISTVDDGFDDRHDDGHDDDHDGNCRWTMVTTMEEELEWISNKDAFPALETFLHTGRDEPPLYMMFEQGSPVSVLENSTLTTSANNGSDGYDSHVNWTNIMDSLYVPVRARSKCSRKRRREGFGEIPALQAWEEDLPGNPIKVLRSYPGKGKAKIGPKCLHCGSEKTPQWRAGPCGPKTLCNACGVRYKSGRLVPEYRPASSPTFSSELHSNSHRRIMEMRRVKGVRGDWR